MIYMETLRERLARRLRRLMDDNPSLDTQVKLSKRAGVSQSTVQRLLTRDAAATLDVVDDLARAFGLRPSNLILADDGEAQILKVWHALSELDRSEVLRFAQLLDNRRQPAGVSGPRLDFEERAEVSPTLHAAVARASARPISDVNNTPTAKRKSNRVSK